MSKIRLYLPAIRRLGLQLLALELVYLGICWLLNKYWSLLQRFTFADVLFIMGTLAALVGSAGMMRSPYREALTPLGVWASPVQPTEDERRVQMVEEYLRRRSFGLRLLAVGVLTFILSAILTYST